MKEIIKDTGIVLGVCLLFTLGVLLFTPYPTTELVYSLFVDGGPAKEPKAYEEVLQQTTVKKDLSYRSLLPQNKYDIVRPKKGEQFPVILWVHGGAYVGGQKEDAEIYAHMLAAKGYAVVNMDYSLAPETRYPGPLVQLNDLYRELKEVAPDYSLDLERLIIAGDSAGGQIAAQFINIQVNDEYSRELNFLQEVPKESIKAALLFCTPFSLSQLTTSSDSFLANYFIRNIGWAYTGDPNWKTSEIANEADLVKNVSGGFPPTFITDGNKGSFEQQAKRFATQLEEQGTKVTPVFYPLSEGELIHEYQFDMTVPQSQQTFASLIDFLKKSDF